MNYRNKIIAELTQLENYARTCFVVHLHLPNGQGETVNKFIDCFMEDLTNGELSLGSDCPEEMRLCTDSNVIYVDTCRYQLLPDCREALGAEDSYLYKLVGDWISDNLFKCIDCGEWYMQPDDYKYNGRCPDCQASENAKDPDTIADFMNDLSRGE